MAAMRKHHCYFILTLSSPKLIIREVSVDSNMEDNKVRMRGKKIKNEKQERIKRAEESKPPEVQSEKVKIK